MFTTARWSRNPVLVVPAIAGLVSIGVTPAVTIGAEGSSEGGFSRVVAFHAERYPAMEIEDLYKLAFQAAMGSEHAMPDRESARQWLVRELSNLGAGSAEPLTEPLSPDGTLVRVNLRVLAEHELESTTVLEAFMTTAQDFAGSRARLRSYWNEIETMAAQGSIAFGTKDLKSYFAARENESFPPVRHSENYRSRYQPAYRVVLRELLNPSSLPTTGQ